MACSWPTLLVLSFLLPGLPAAAAQGQVPFNATEAAALLEFKAALLDSQALEDWADPGNMCANWTGVQCSAAGQVTKL